MADIQVADKKSRRRLQAPRVDLTPMVDLGFLLITFFMYTTTMTQPSSLVLNRPIVEPVNNPNVYIDTSTITIIPTANNTYAYYSGILEAANDINRVNYSDVRKLIIRKQSELKHLPEEYSEQARKLHVIIKPADDCTYENVVAILDEMLINQVPYYTLVDITNDELEMLEK